jgi:predicted amidophosphoribosyltransferase
MTAIHKFKYGAKSFLANSLGLLLAEFAESWIKESKNLLTIPVPLHPKRLRERGFNQSVLTKVCSWQGMLPANWILNWTFYL